MATLMHGCCLGLTQHPLPRSTNRDLLQTLVFSAFVPSRSMADSKRKRPRPPGSSCQPMTPGVSDNFPNFMAILMGQL